MKSYQITGTVVLVAFTAAFAVHADGEHHPHTLANTFGNVYTTTGFGKSNAPANPVTFVLA
jgi:hypothetical protein